LSLFKYENELSGIDLFSAKKTMIKWYRAIKRYLPGPGARFYETDAGRVEAAEQRLDSGEYVRDSDINW